MGNNNGDYAGIIIMPGCMNECFFCKPYSKIFGERLDLNKQKINILKNLIEFKKKGMTNIEISGCDPIEYNYIVELIEYIKNLGFKNILLSTHGRLFSNKIFSKKMRDAGLTKVRIPIYGSTAKTHELITLSEGSFKEAIDGIKNLSNSKIEVIATSLITKSNKTDLIRMVDLLKKIGISKLYISIPFFAVDSEEYIPLKDLNPILNELSVYAKKIGFNIRFQDIPYCAIGRFDDCILNNQAPTNLGENCQPIKALNSGIKDMPIYRVKIKKEFCKLCRYKDDCSGFINMDVARFGVGNIRPVL